MTDSSEVVVSQIKDRLALAIEQYPPVEGISRYRVVGSLVEDLLFQTGSIFTVFEVKDVFSQPKSFQLHHNGHNKAWIALNRRKGYRIELLSFDGFRLRVRYRQGKRSYGTVVYLEDPSKRTRWVQRMKLLKASKQIGLESHF